VAPDPPVTVDRAWSAAAAAIGQSEVGTVGRVCAVVAAQATWGTCASTSCTRADAGSWLCAHRVCREEPNDAKSARRRATAQVAAPPSTSAGRRDQTDTAVAAASMPGDQPINLSFPPAPACVASLVVPAGHSAALSLTPAGLWNRLVAGRTHDSGAEPRSAATLHPPGSSRVHLTVVATDQAGKPSRPTPADDPICAVRLPQDAVQQQPEVSLDQGRASAGGRPRIYCRGLNLSRGSRPRGRTVRTSSSGCCCCCRCRCRFARTCALIRSAQR